jgi:hypothetical protein
MTSGTCHDFDKSKNVKYRHRLQFQTTTARLSFVTQKGDGARRPYNHTEQGMVTKSKEAQARETEKKRLAREEEKQRKGQQRNEWKINQQRRRDLKKPAKQQRAMESTVPSTYSNIRFQCFCHGRSFCLYEISQ